MNGNGFSLQLKKKKVEASLAFTQGILGWYFTIVKYFGMKGEKIFLNTY